MWESSSMCWRSFRLSTEQFEMLLTVGAIRGNREWDELKDSLCMASAVLQHLWLWQVDLCPDYRLLCTGRFLKMWTRFSEKDIYGGEDVYNIAVSQKNHVLAEREGSTVLALHLWTPLLCSIMHLTSVRAQWKCHNPNVTLTVINFPNPLNPGNLLFDNCWAIQSSLLWQSLGFHHTEGLTQQ